MVEVAVGESPGEDMEGMGENGRAGLCAIVGEHSPLLRPRALKVAGRC